MAEVSAAKALTPILTAVESIARTPPQRQHPVNNLRQYRYEV